MIIVDTRFERTRACPL